MAVHQTDEHKAYSGMATAYAPADTPGELCQYAEGFTPARRGRMNLAPLLKRLQRSFTNTIWGTAVWLTEAGEGDRLLIFSGTNLYSTQLYNVWKYDERIDGQHSFYQLGSFTTLSTGFNSTPSAGMVQSVQKQTELILSVGGPLYRYYVDTDGIGSEHLYLLGVMTPGIPTLGQGIGGNLTLGATYHYVVTYADEFGRESSPSPIATVVLTGSNNEVFVAQNTGPYASGGGEVTWNIYRQNPGSATFNFVANLPLATTGYTDTASDPVVNAGRPAPTPGENDVPGALGPPFRGQSNIMCVWKDRLVLNDMLAPNIVQVSNSGSPTQFSSLPLPTNLTDGLRVPIGGKGQNEVTGLASLGSLLAMFGRETTNLLYGDDISSFTRRETLERGCQNPGSVQRCENVINFLSDNDIYSIGYEDGYAVNKVSSPISDIFKGFAPTADPTNPAAIGRPASVQVQAALFGNVLSFYSENRYYLSIGGRTLCLDMESGGWTDTGWGALKTATRYLSQMNSFSSSSPETVFLTLGDVNTFSNELRYFTVADTPTDVDAPSSVKSKIVMRPLDAPNGAQQHSRRAVLLSQYGKTRAKRGDVIGNIRWFGDGQFISGAPIHAWVIWKRRGALFEMAAPPYTGEVIWAELSFTVNDIELQNAVFEEVLVN